MSGHIGSGNSEPGDLRKAMDALSGRTRRGQIEEWPNRKIGRQPLEVGLPDQARTPAGAVACGAVTAKEPFTVVGIGLSDGGRGGIPKPLRSLMLFGAGGLETQKIGY
jgi:hypothetical protein